MFFFVLSFPLLFLFHATNLQLPSLRNRGQNSGTGKKFDYFAVHVAYTQLTEIVALIHEK